MVKLVATIAVVLSACAYDAQYGDCAVHCTDSSGCPDGLTCGSDGLCGAGSTNACNEDVPDGGAHIAILVQAQTRVPSGITPSLTLAPVSPQDAIIVCFDYPASDGATFDSATDSLGNNFQVVESLLSAGAVHFVAAAYGSQGGPDTITLTMSAPLSGGNLMIAEYSGLALSNAADARSVASDTGAVMDSGPGLTHFADELVLGYATAISATPGAGFMERAGLTGNIIEDKVVSTTGTYNATATTTAGPWTMIMVTFRGR